MEVVELWPQKNKLFVLNVKVEIPVKKKIAKMYYYWIRAIGNGGAQGAPPVFWETDTKSPSKFPPDTTFVHPLILAPCFDPVCSPQYELVFLFLSVLRIPMIKEGAWRSQRPLGRPDVLSQIWKTNATPMEWKLHLFPFVRLASRTTLSQNVISIPLSCIWDKVVLEDLALA